jgi:carbonic anhydrase/acetyltransferase-like protein (isoleucine patch superfamily)
MGAILSIWSEVGEGAIVAEGSVVKANQKVPAAKVAAGNPARIVRDVSEKDTELWALGKQIYIDLAAKYLAQGMTPVG